MCKATAGIEQKISVDIRKKERGRCREEKEIKE